MSSEADAGEVIVNKPTTTATTTTSTTTTTTTMTTLTGVKSQPIQFISNKKMTNSLDARSMELPLHYNPLLNHHTHTNHASSLIEHFATGSFGPHSYLLSTSGGKNTSSNSNLGNNDAKSTGHYLSEINEFSNNRVSAFLPLEEIKINDQAGAKNEIVSRIFTEVREVQEGKVDNLLRVMSFHPEFLQEFINLYNYLMYSQHGALPYDSRHFIAIMAATRHKCIYLVKQQEREFLNRNGQKSWLHHGIQYIPQKLKDLYELNKLLCHQPWLINHTHLEKILKGPYSWTVTELTMAITILTLFHSLSGFVFGCGINENYTQELIRQYEREEEEEMKRRRQRAAKSLAKSSRKNCVGNKNKKKRGKRNRNVASSGGVVKSYDELSDDNDASNTRSAGLVRLGQPAASTTRRPAATSQSHNHINSNNKNDFDEYGEDEPYNENDDDEVVPDEDNDDYDDDDEDKDDDVDDDDDDNTTNNNNNNNNNNEEDRDEDEYDNDENLDMCGGGGVVSAAQLHARNSRATNYHRTSSGSSCDMYANVTAPGGSSRNRSNSTGASNRTLSNSSASSCEVGIDLLLKEMQMINQKSEDKQNQQQQQQQQNHHAGKSLLSTSVSSTSSSILSSSYIIQKIIRSTSPNACSASSGYYTTTTTTPTTPANGLSGSGCFSPPSSQHHQLSTAVAAAAAATASSSGPSTITNNSPITNNNNNNNTNSTVASPTNCYNYLNDVSNTSLNGSSTNGTACSVNGRSQYHYIHQTHDNNNNSIHHSYHHHHNYHANNHYHHNGAASKIGEMSENGSDVESEKQQQQQQQAVESATSTAKNKTHRTTTSTVKFDNGVSVKSVDDDLDDQPMLHTYMNDQTNNHNNNNNHHFNHNHHHNNNHHQHEPVSQSVINQKIREYMLKYAFDPDYGYQDFEASADQSLRLEYYTWENQGYITVASFYPDICEFLDKNFQVAANMTYNTMGNVKGVDTSLFRKAVWFYTHSLFGVKYDDYDYSQIRILLKSPLRKYIKTVCTQPERITKAHYDSIMKEFTHSEKVHMNLVIMEARIQASMLYFLRAVNTYFG